MEGKDQVEYWGIDTEASCTGQKPTLDDIHTIQACSSKGEHTGRVFWSKEEFKYWLQNLARPRPRIFYAFTLPFEYGTLAAWELLHVENRRGQYPWQDWTNEPINLFYIKLGKRIKIPVYDIRLFFYQLRYGNNYLTNLKALGDYLSSYFKEDIHKLEAPLGKDFGKRPPRPEEKEYFERYGIRDAYITAKGAQWVHENIMQGWLQNKVPITKIYSWGTVAKHYFDLPKINDIHYYKREVVVAFPNLWHEKIYHCIFAGRSEAFTIGNVGQVYYNDVSSLYPVSMIQTQAMLIDNAVEWQGNPDALIGKPINWKLFHEVTGKPYGWILGTFQSTDDLWGFPIRIGENNHYVVGTLRNKLYHSLDLEASRARALDVQKVLVPEYDESQKLTMKKFEQLTNKKLKKQYSAQIEKFAIKSTINSASGILGKHNPFFGDTTNLPAYSTLLAQSHLNMSKIFHLYHSPEHPILYTDTDSFFWCKPVEEVIENCKPYPGLPFQTLDTVPLEVGVRASSRPEGTVIFRGKMYYQNTNSFACSAWKPFSRFFVQICTADPKLKDIWVERQVIRKWKTRDRRATVLKIGRWFIIREHWEKEKLNHIFRADRKRNRQTHNSYQLFLNDEKCSSRAWTVEEALSKLKKERWEVRYKRELEPIDFESTEEENSEIRSILGEKREPDNAWLF